MAARQQLILLGAVATLLFAAATAWVVLSSAHASGKAHDGGSLAAIANAGGCRLVELDAERPTNPPVTGKFSERQWIRNGDYSQATRPVLLPAVIHALLHGRVALQYRPGLRPTAIARIRALYREDPRNVLLFANQTGMPYDVAATAYLSAVVCPRVGTGALDVLRAFRERRRDFAQGF